MRIGVDVGGTNTDAVLMDGATVVAWTKQPTTGDVGSGVEHAISTVLKDGAVSPGAIASVMIGTTHFTNALVERSRLDRVGILRLASPAGEALPPMTGWPTALAEQIDAVTYLLPGGFEVDGREIAPLDEPAIRAAARELRSAGILSVAITAVFAPVNPAMEERAAAIVADEHPAARITVSHALGRLGFVERENAAILNAALGSLAGHVVTAFGAALKELGIEAPLYISQNDGTLISAAHAAAYPVLTIGSGPTNSMRGAAFLTGVRDAIVLDVGGTTTDLGVLANGFPRESAVAVDIGGVRINFRMPDILALGLGGGSRIHLDREGGPAGMKIGPDSVGYRITQEAMLFGGDTLTASDIAVAAGRAQFGDPAGLPALAPSVVDGIWSAMQSMLEEAVDRMKTSRDDVVVLAVGGGNFLVPDTLRGATRVVRPPHAAVANAVGAAIAQVGSLVDKVVSYEREPRTATLERLRDEARAQAIAAGGVADSVEIVEVDEVYLSYLPGRAAQVRVRAVADLAEQPVLVDHAH
ncbi:hydantoinase/oxoprolinase family protein [Sphingomonas sp. BK235]|uniref:hydantoinase/oxoprolinase N-terminal domain-containing protein n=1 Tax=Sphingomonas sp. BK235 TaxID=2512131 RepID=UPI001043EF67|nr:hydantoinase/oxoprolinase family protein [Sphingomonas sp. BK235]